MRGSPRYAPAYSYCSNGNKKTKQNEKKKQNNQNRTIKTTLTATQKQNPQNKLLIQYAPKTSGHTVTCNFPSSPTEISP